MQHMKTHQPFETVNVQSKDLERVITKLSAEGRRILSAKVVSEDRYELRLAKRRKPRQADIAPSATKSDTSP